MLEKAGLKLPIFLPVRFPSLARELLPGLTPSFCTVLQVCSTEHLSLPLWGPPSLAVVPLASEVGHMDSKGLLPLALQEC